MSDCPDCLLPYASTLDEYRGGRFCGRDLSRFDCNDTDHLERNCFAFALEQTRLQLALAVERAETAELALQVKGSAMPSSPLYRLHSVWNSMKQRCYNPKNKSYARYGAKGITVCQRWRDSFQAFLADMGPSVGRLTVERIDSSLGYCPENCRWASYAEQNRNLGSRNRMITFNGKTQCLQDWANSLGLSSSGLVSRLKKYPVEQALARPNLKLLNPESGAKGEGDGEG